MRKSPKIPRSDTGAARELEKIRITGWTKNNEKGTKVCRLREGWEEAAMSGMEGEGGERMTLEGTGVSRTTEREDWE